MFGIDDLIGQGLSIINKFIPDTAAQAQAAAEFKTQVLTLQAQMNAAQSATDTAEASSGNRFAANWRPFVGWVCGVAFAWHFVIQPILNYVLMTLGFAQVNPVFDMATLYTVLMGLLGMGGLHTYENVKGGGK